MNIGILALQGDFLLHQKLLDKINISNILIKNLSELSEISGLIIPGGESTVISKMIDENNFFNALKEFSKRKPIYGTCAGAILMSSLLNDSKVMQLSVIDFEVIRNAWGRQIDSFSTDIELSFSDKKFRATFIRAPKFICNNKVNILAKYNDEPVLLRNNMHLVSSFHPEIGSDTRIHKYFIKMINEC